MPNACCIKPITPADLKQIFTAADDVKLAEMASAFNEAFIQLSVNTCLRKAHLFAQLLEEVGQSATNHAESLNYAADRLKRKVAQGGKNKGPFSYFWNHPNDADLYGRKPETGTITQKANEEQIANRAYAGVCGNGDIASGDGWKFRGRGYIQLTGRANYADVQKHLDQKVPASGIDIINDEHAITTTKGALLSAMGFWSLRNACQKADFGTTNAAVDGVTAIVNKNTDSYAKRADHFQKVTRAAFRVDQCPGNE